MVIFVLKVHPDGQILDLVLNFFQPAGFGLKYQCFTKTCLKPVLNLFNENLKKKANVKIYFQKN